MADRPILFQGAMVRAILDGSKTQTRRIAKGMPGPGGYRVGDTLIGPGGRPIKVPYGQPGDRLWVRETWGVGSRPDPWGGYDGIEYRADQAWLEEGDDLPCHKVQTPDDVCLGDYRSGWKPSIHMPRWACRLVLEIVDVRVERLQDISEADAKAEGADCLIWSGIPGGAADLIDWPLKEVGNPYRNGYALLWAAINGDGSWAANPWVWVVEFRRVDGHP
jgi:hypothetical protein